MRKAKSDNLIVFAGTARNWAFYIGGIEVGFAHYLLSFMIVIIGCFFVFLERES